jgi:hypothetical protein
MEIRKTKGPQSEESESKRESIIDANWNTLLKHQKADIKLLLICMLVHKGTAMYKKGENLLW